MRSVSLVCGLVALSLGVAAQLSAQSADDRIRVVRARALGLNLYTEHCASCHGRTGHGTGPRSEDLRAKASDLTRLAERHQGIFPADAVRRAIEGADPAHRSRDMPLWGEVFRAGGGTPDAQARIDALVHYLEFIQYRPRR